MGGFRPCHWLETAYSFLKGQLGLAPVPIDNLKKHSAPEHFGLEISGVLFPVGGFPDAKPWFIAKTGTRIVGRESAAYTLVHHGQAVVRERLIVHRPLRKSRRLIALVTAPSSCARQR